VRRWLRALVRGAPRNTSGSSDCVPAWVGHEGWPLDETSQLELLTEYESADYQSLFETLRADADLNVGFDGVDYRPLGLIHNGYFPTPDAEVYGAMIVRERPHRIVGIGSDGLFGGASFWMRTVGDAQHDAGRPRPKQV